MSPTTRRFGAALVVGALALAGIGLTASAASAAQISGQIHLYGQGTQTAPLTRGAEILSGSVSANPMFYGISVDATCPTGFKQANGILIFQGGVQKGGIAAPLTTAEGTAFGQWGSTASNIAISDADNGGLVNGFAANKALSGISGLADGAFELRYYCRASDAVLDLATDQYFSLALTKSGATWSVPVPAENTSVSLTAGAVGTTVTLTGTVKNSSNATATAAAGTVQFFELPNTTTPVATVAVASGVATATLTGVANGAHQYQAKFVSTDTVYNSSALSGSASAIVGTNTQQTNVTVTVPDNVGALILSGVPSSVDLGTAALNGTTLDASGTLAGVTVTDTRQLNYPAWSLTGQIGDFTKTGGGTLLGKYLGWVPSKVSGPASTVAGSTVAPATSTGEGLSTTPKSLGTGAPDASGTVSVFNAQLNLKAPANTPAGAYSALLTITLS